MKQGKVWGITEVLDDGPFFSAHRLCIKAGTRCSMHMHEHKANAFYVEKGHLRIVCEKQDYDLVDVTDLRAREYTVVPPGEWHRFEAVTDVEALEWYYPVPLSSDIKRRDHGGAMEDNEAV